ncbi:proteasome endopeptidase complex, beta subunit [Methanocaldococcus sp. FS406-22]|jgi:proteasome beta subunit|uniref:Proteasome subunit beta n=1 Tax=Methanocaldococcus sp. (strain FS406-22) TaxID=644281 RepID=PSB_METSF|nr:archaeal proteasome endopeptidase complex subunit beta [Methanocaldococcus sp. FS406-22]D3S8M7.1 RecName: Full=Proteasome subunit beta; AltName: Full=20S proteasome beta subunit; AltName: Full=Proteasome core protein PsmB; Flags: Precursor [Methanocaldococcus sp. FS406-22]ADC69387.1 proteasome endopeptidase complex, beta subunit [Methanocaldococcus sp. FS406-22]
MDVMKGTTTVGLICDDAVILATDKRASLGNLVADKEAKKLYKIDDYIAMTIAGSVGDAQAIVRLLTAEAKLYKMRTGRNIPPLACATLLSNILHSSRVFPFLTQIIIGGYDLLEGAKLFSLDPLGGMNEEKTFTATGSGSPIAYGVLEAGYDREMSVEEGIKLAINALKSAMERDTFSGNGISLAVITKEGVKIFEDEEIEKILDGMKAKSKKKTTKRGRRKSK